MKKTNCGAMGALLLALLCLSCQIEDPAEPQLSAIHIQEAVQGRWKIQKVDYQLCRSGNCSKTNYKGTEQDYFEFRKDSAFLVHNTASNTRSWNAFKAEYNLPGALVLTQEFWSVRYEVEECKPTKMVLVGSYVGNDPYAIFTDTYYLYR